MDRNIMSLINHTHFVYDRLMTSILKHHVAMNISASQLRILESLWSEDGIRSMTLAKKLGIRKGSLSTMLPRLIDLGYIEILPDPEDGRATRIYLTEAGIKLREKHQNQGFHLENEIIQDLTPAEIEQLILLLNKVEANVIRLEEQFEK